MSLTTLAAIEQQGKMTAVEFKQIHDQTGLSGAQLSEAIELNKTLVSRYRLGRLRIPSKVAHAMRNVGNIAQSN